MVIIKDGDSIAEAIKKQCTDERGTFVGKIMDRSIEHCVGRESIFHFSDGSTMHVSGNTDDGYKFATTKAKEEDNKSMSEKARIALYGKKLDLERFKNICLSFDGKKFLNSDYYTGYTFSDGSTLIVEHHTKDIKFFP